MRSHCDSFTSFDRLYAQIKRLERKHDAMGGTLTAAESKTLVDQLRKIADKIEVASDGDAGQ